MYSLPLPRLTVDNPYFDALVSRAACLTCVRDDFADLWRDVMGEPFTLAQTPPPSPLPEASKRGTKPCPAAETLAEDSPLIAMGGDTEGGWQPVVDAAQRQVFRNEIDALVAHLYGLSHDEFAHILATFPLVFADDAVGKTKKEALLAVYDTFADTVKDWSRA
ncbi:MAG: hypothetical protein Q9P01_06795 [Anaerolineae bacterium]|nr:hypothetical protein [Anaerolineae bacterium]